MADRIQQRRDTAARWAQYNPILLEGEVGYVTDNPNQYKIGDGIHSWNDLPFRGFSGTLTQEITDSDTEAPSGSALVKELKKIDASGSTNFNTIPRWVNGEGDTVLTDGMIGLRVPDGDAFVLDYNLQNIFPYRGNALKFVSSVNATRDWRIGYENKTKWTDAGFKVGDKVRVTAEFNVKNLTDDSTFTINLVFADKVVSKLNITTDGNYIFDCKLIMPDTDVENGKSNFQLFFPRYTSNGINLEVTVGRVYFGLDSYGSIDGDNLIFNKLLSAINQIELLDEYDKKIDARTILDTPLVLEVSEMDGQAFEGAELSDDQLTLTIPSGVSGLNSYLQGLFYYDGTLINKMIQCTQEGARLWCLFSFKTNNESLIPRFSFSFQPSQSGNLNTFIVYRKKIGDVWYCLVCSDSSYPIGTTKGPRAYIQLTTALNPDDDFTITWVDATMFLGTDKFGEGMPSARKFANDLFDFKAQKSASVKYDEKNEISVIMERLSTPFSILRDSARGESLNGAVITTPSFNDVMKLEIPPLKTGANAYINATWGEDTINAIKTAMKSSSFIGKLRFIAEIIFDGGGTYNSEQILSKISMVPRDQSMNSGITSVIGVYNHPSGLSNSRLVVLELSADLDDSITSLNWPFQVDSVGFTDSERTGNIVFQVSSVALQLINESLGENEMIQYELCKLFSSKRAGYQIDTLPEAEWKIAKTVPFFSSCNSIYKPINESNFFAVMSGGETFGKYWQFQLFNSRGAAGAGRIGLSLNDRICYAFDVRAKKSNQFGVEKFLSAAYYRINGLDGSYIGLTYIYNANSGFVNRYVRFKEDNDYYYYHFYGYITINQSMVDADEEVNVKAIEITFMNAEHDVIENSIEFFITNARMGIISNNYDLISQNLSDKVSIENKINALYKVIGTPYNVDYIDPMKSIAVHVVDGASIVNFATGKLGFRVNNGAVENGNYIDVLIDYNRFFGTTSNAPAYDMFFAFTGNESNAFKVEIFDEHYNKLDNGTWWYDFNNGWIRVNYTLSKFISNERVIVRLTATTGIENGFDCYYDHTLIDGYGTKMSIDDRLKVLEGQNAPNIVVSPSGKKFEIIVSDDGVLSTKNYYFSKIMHITHSFGYHGPAPQLGWNPSETWGMAAETKEKDYIHKLFDYMKTVNPEVQISHIVNVADFEQNHQNPDYDMSKWDYLNNYEFDCIVVRIGENAGGKWQDFGDHIIDLIENHVGVGKTYKVFISSMFALSSDTQDNVSQPMNIELNKVATHFGTKLAMINKNNSSDHSVNTYNAWNPNDLLPPKPDGSQYNKETEVNSGVTSGHPGNHGMEMIADEFWKEIKRTYGINE